MELSVLAFGIAKDIFGGSVVSVHLSGTHPTVAALRQHLEQLYPQLAGIRSYMVAVNDEYAGPDVLLVPDDEIAIIPPVSGG